MIEDNDDIFSGFIKMINDNDKIKFGDIYNFSVIFRRNNDGSVDFFNPSIDGIRKDSGMNMKIVKFSQKEILEIIGE